MSVAIHSKINFQHTKIGRTALTSLSFHHLSLIHNETRIKNSLSIAFTTG